MKQFLHFLILLPWLSTIAVGQPTLPALHVNKGDRYITRSDGKPFFWLGDTAWELFHRLTLEEAKLYLQNRAKKGYNVVLAVANAEFGGQNIPNRYGAVAFENYNPGKPNEAYFQHVDAVIGEAAKLGIYIALLPTWGDKFSKKWDPGPEMFTPENARSYGNFLGKRFQGKNIIWVLGGDRDPENETHLAIINAMAKGIREITGQTQLMTYHPTGASFSSRYFQQSDWLDFNMFQSGHSLRNQKNYLMVRNDYEKAPVKPTLDAEPRYENHPVNWKPELGYFDDFDVRQAAWWAFLSGAAGHTYGCHDVWQMFDSGSHQPMGFARTNWQVAIDLPGSTQMGYLKNLATSHPWHRLLPANQIILNENPENEAFQIAALSADKDFLFIYSPAGKPIKADLSKFSSTALIAYWFNPRDGSSVKIGDFNNKQTPEFKPYAAGPETDWVLVVDDASKPWAGYNLKE